MRGRTGRGTVARRATGALALAALAGLAGCSADGAGPTPPSDPPPSAPVDGGDDGDDGSPAPEAARRGPLDELLDAVAQVSAETPEAQLARLQHSDEIVSACMAEQGFEYEPTDWGPVVEAQRAREATREQVRADGGADDPVAAAQEHGYGFFTTQRPEPEGAFIWTDPNAEQVAQMSDAEQRAWDLALYGTGQGEDYAAGLEPYDWRFYGCMGVSDHELGIDTKVWFDDASWADLRLAIDALRESLGQDPRLDDARRAWVDCMTEAGHPGYTSVREPMDEMARRSEQVWAEATAGVQLDLTTDEYLTDPAYLRQQEDLAAMGAALAPVEIELAVADATCRAEAGYDRAAAEVWLLRQEEFFAEHRAELEAWVAAFEEFQASR